MAADRAATLEGGGNLSLFLPPNLHQAPPLSKTGGHVTPLYASAPAPMGVAYYGLNNTTGTIQSTTMNTTSLQSYFTTSDSLGVETEEFDFGTQTSYGAQLNAVLTNVTILGQNGFGPNVNAPSGCSGFFSGVKSNYCPNQFWLQNVLNYNAATHSLSFENNIWNFSNPTAAWATTNGFTLEGRSTPRGGYYAVGGPSFTISYPFTVVLYLNTTVGTCTTGSPGAASCGAIKAGPVNEVFFNYTVYNSAGAVVCPTSLASHTKCGEYDDVFWNSISSTVNPSGVPFGSAQISANGNQYDPVGLTNDWEMDWGIGTSSGATTVVAYADAQVGINYCPKADTNTHSGKCSSYRAPPAAYDYGGETGETNTGAGGYWVTQTGAGPNPSFLTRSGQPVARFVTGPSLLLGLWNASASGAGAYALNYRHIQPSNAWVGLAAGAAVTNQSKFQVAPTFGWYSHWKGSGGAGHGTTLGANLYLPPGLYTIEVLLSGRDPWSQTINLTASSATPTINLRTDRSTGVYTPMWAFGASDLANLSLSGAGTSSSPYQLLTAPGTVGAPYGVSGSVSWLFSDLNDYLFTVWLGAYLNSTHAYATFNPAPMFRLAYPSWQYSSLAFFNVPKVDGLQYYLYHSQNVTVAHGTNLYAWANSEATSVTSVVCNTCLNDLFASNRFNVSDIGISFSGSTGALAHNTLAHARNVLWGNAFVAAAPGAYAGLIAPTRFVTESDSNDRLYNNNFEANLTISETSTSNINYWNVSCQAGYAPLHAGYYPGPTVCQPSSYSVSMNGFALTGSILGTAYQGGNFWYNYGNFANPFANLPYVGRTTSYSSGGIGQPTGHRAGDFAPLLAFRVYKVPFTEQALPSSSSSTAFAVRVRNALNVGTKNSTATTAVPAGCTGVVCLNFYLPNGSYTFGAQSSLSGYPATPQTGSFTVSGAALAATNIVFGSAVTFTETGLPSGIKWFVNITGQSSLSTTTTGGGGTMLSIQLPNGTYTYHAASSDKHWTPTYTPSFTVSGVPLGVGIAYSLVTYTTTFTESGLPSGTGWWLNITGQGSLHATGPTITTPEPNGSYTYTAASADKSYSAFGGSFSVHGSGPSVPVAFALLSVGPSASVNPVDEHQGSTISAGASGGSGSYPTYAWSGLPSGCAAPGNVASFVCTPALGDSSGSPYTVQVTVTDSNGARVTSSFTLVVDPVLTGSPSATPNPVDEGQATTIGAGEAGGSGTYAYVWSGLPSGCGTPGDVASFSCTPAVGDAAGSPYTVSVQVTDGNGNVVTESFTLAVDPELTASPSATVNPVDELQTTAISASASGGLGPYSYAWSGLPSGCGAPGDVASFSCTPAVGDAAGSPYTVSVQVTDGNGNVVTESFTLTVDPALTVSPSATVNPVDEDQATTISANAAGGADYAYVWSGLPSGCGAPGDVASFSCTPAVGDSAGSPYTVTVQVTDANGNVVTGSFTMIVDPMLNAGAPGATPNPVTVGQPTTISTTASGGSGTYGYLWSGLPSGCSSTAASFSCTPTVTGTYTISVEVTDGNGATATASFSLDVTPVPVYLVTFTESNLPAGTLWYVNVSGQPSQHGTGTQLTLYLVNGDYTFTVGTVNKHWAASAGSFTVSSLALPVGVTFTKQTYTVTFTATFPTAKAQLKTMEKKGWTVVLNGTVEHSLTPTISFSGIPNGTLPVLIFGPSGFEVTGSGTVVVKGTTGVAVTVTKGKTVTLTFHEKGLKGVSWCVSLDGYQLCSSTTASQKFVDLTPGTYSYGIGSVAGYTVTAKVGKGTISTPTGTLAVTKGTTVQLKYVALGGGVPLVSGGLEARTLGGSGASGGRVSVGVMEAVLSLVGLLGLLGAALRLGRPVEGLGEPKRR